MKLGGPARFFVDVRKAEEIPNLYKTAEAQSLPIAILGGGSNTLIRDEGFGGIVIHVRIPGIDIIEEDLYSVTFKIGAGENWDSFVQKIVEMRLTGVEAMSGIPGTVGAAPVQNIGAYGQEIADTLVSLEAYDTQNDQFVTLLAGSCHFSYRDSIFKREEKGRFIITNVTLKLSKNLPSPPFYAALQDYFDKNSITTYTHQTIRDAVLAIRSEKLPDPAVKPNAGSFFKNAVIDGWLLPEIQSIEPDVPFYDMGDGRFKIPSGWLIEKAGLKGMLISGIRVHDKNALVLINESATGFTDLMDARDKIATEVRAKFRINLEQEPIEL